MLARPSRTGILVLVALLEIACRVSEPGGAPSSSSSSTPADGDALIIPIDSDPPSLDFVSCSDSWCRLVAHFVADALVDEGERLETVPRLAERWEFAEEGRELVFHLRQGVRWHDGSPFTADDVLFTYRRTIDPASGAHADLFQDILEVTAPDPLTVKVRYREPTVLALDAWKVPIVPQHLLAAVPAGTKDPARTPIGTGPFRFVRWTRGSEIVLQANPSYFLGRPHLDSLVFRIIPSPATQFQSLLTGDTDWSSIPPSEWSKTAASADFLRRFRRYEYPALFVYYIAWNGKGPLFADARVRRAMTLLLDRSGFLAKANAGAGVVAASSFHPKQFGYDPKVAPLPYDPTAAAALLDEAGWKRSGSDGQRVKSGRPLRFSLLIFQGNPVQQQVASLFSDALRRQGITLDIRVFDFPALLERLQRRDFDAAFSGWALTTDPDPTAFFHSDARLGTSNYAGYSNPEMDRLLLEGRHALDPDQRRRIYARVQEIVAADQPYTFLFFPLARIGMDNRFEGVSSAGVISPLKPYPGPLRWFVPRERQKRRSSP